MAADAPLVLIGGPTASGKSRLAMMLADLLGGMIINADSMQVYRNLPILTAMPSEDALRQQPHAVYAVLDGAERCSVARWLDLAGKAVATARANGLVPILTGGSGLYLAAARDGISPMPDIPPAVRAEATAMHGELGGAAFRRQLAIHDPQLAGRLKDGDSQRLIRGMETWLATSTPLSIWQQQEPVGRLPGQVTAINVMPPRNQLYERIDSRLVMMLEAGVTDEIKRFLALGLDQSLPLMKALGLRPFATWLAGCISRDAALAAAQQESRRYAKRQMTWFRHRFSANFIEENIYAAQFSESFLRKILSFIRKTP